MDATVMSSALIHGAKAWARMAWADVGVMGKDLFIFVET
jgi:hypothetical protein